VLVLCQESVIIILLIYNSGWSSAVNEIWRSAVNNLRQSHSVDLTIENYMLSCARYCILTAIIA